jgi:hypothetical protein
MTATGSCPRMSPGRTGYSPLTMSTSVPTDGRGCDAQHRLAGHRYRLRALLDGQPVPPLEGNSLHGVHLGFLGSGLVPACPFRKARSMPMPTVRIIGPTRFDHCRDRASFCARSGDYSARHGVCRAAFHPEGPEAVGCEPLLTPPGRTREPRHRDDLDAEYEPRATLAPARSAVLSARAE